MRDELIDVTINGEARRVPGALTVRALLEHLGVTGAAAVEKNREIVPRAAHATTAVAAGDVYEIVDLVGGG